MRRRNAMRMMTRIMRMMRRMHKWVRTIVSESKAGHPLKLGGHARKRNPTCLGLRPLGPNVPPLPPQMTMQGVLSCGIVGRGHAGASGPRNFMHGVPLATLGTIIKTWGPSQIIKLNIGPESRNLSAAIASSSTCVAILFGSRDLVWSRWS